MQDRACAGATDAPTERGARQQRDGDQRRRDGHRGEQRGRPGAAPAAGASRATACRREQLGLEVTHEVAHAPFPSSRWRRPVRPRETRLRMTDSDVCGAGGDVGVLVLVEHAGEHRLALIGRERGQALVQDRRARAGDGERLDALEPFVGERDRAHAEPAARPILDRALVGRVARAGGGRCRTATPPPALVRAVAVRAVQARRRTSPRSGRRRAPRRACGARSTRAAGRRGAGRRPRTPRARPAWRRAGRRRSAHPSVSS